MNATEIISTVRVTGQIAPEDPTYTDAVILGEAHQVLIERFAERISNMRQGYWKHRIDVPVASGNGFYQMPPRALIQGLETVEMNEQSNGEHFRQLTILTDTQAQKQFIGHFGPSDYYILEGDGIRILPAPTNSVTLRFTYILRPPKLTVYPNTVGSSIIAKTEHTVTTDAALVADPLSPLQPFSATNQKVDIQHINGSHELAVVDGQLVDVTGSVWTFANDVDLSKVKLFDRLNSPDTAPYPTLPLEMHRALCDYTAANIWLSKGDHEKSQLLNAKAEEGIKRIVNMAQPRVRTAPFTWRNPNSFLRRNL